MFLRLQNVSKSFADQAILTDVNLDVSDGEMVSIMGKSGTGKSTLLAMMAGLVRPDAGQVLFNGQDLTTSGEEELAAFRLRHVGFVFQDFKLIPSLSVHDNVLLGIFPRREVAPGDKRSRVIECVKQVGLEGKMLEKADVLSGGEKQRVAIARGLVNRPALVLADEPTGNLDEITSEEIMDLFRRLHHETSTTFLIVTHDREIAEKTEKTYQLKNGVLRS